MIEFELDEIATDVRSNINALFTRGEQMEQLDNKAEDLKSSSASVRKKAKQVRMQGESYSTIAGIGIFMFMMLIFVWLSKSIK